jgi:hypothetical protein
MSPFQRSLEKTRIRRICRFDHSSRRERHRPSRQECASLASIGKPLRLGLAQRGHTKARGAGPSILVVVLDIAAVHEVLVPHHAFHEEISNGQKPAQEQKPPRRPSKNVDSGFHYGRRRRRDGSFPLSLPFRLSCQALGLQPREVVIEGFLSPFVVCHCLLGFDLPPRSEFQAQRASGVFVRLPPRR